MKPLLAMLWAVILLLPSSQTYADTLRVAVAANFKLAAEELRQIFEQQTEHQLKLISASTGVLYNQILHGAPYDLFLAADSERPLLLEQQQLAVAGSRVTYALGQLVLVHRQDTELSANDLGALLKPGTKIAIANPKIAPYGKAAQQTLLYLGIDPAQLRIITSLNVALCYQLWDSGNVDLALVSASQSQHPEAVKIPSFMHDRIKQQAIVLDTAKHNSAAWEFMAFMNSPAARSVIVSHGYGLVEPI